MYMLSTVSTPFTDGCISEPEPTTPTLIRGTRNSWRRAGPQWGDMGQLCIFTRAYGLRDLTHSTDPKITGLVNPNPNLPHRP